MTGCKMTNPIEINPDDFLSEIDSPFKIEFSHLIGTVFFVGPLSKPEAVNQITTYFTDTQPALIYKENDKYFCVYP